MAKRVSLADRLDDALEAMMASPTAPLQAGDPRLGELLEIAGELSRRPTEEFKARLKADLEGRGSEASLVEPDVEISYRAELHLPVRGASRLIDFVKQAFTAEEEERHADADGSIKHAAVRIGDSVFSVGDSEMAEPAPKPTAIHLYVPDADAVYRQALGAGAASMYEPMDQPYGDREAGVRDPFGNHWYIGTHRASGADRPASHIPEGLRTVNSYLHPRGAAELVGFLRHAFGAEEAFRAEAPDGSVAHAKIRIGESVVEMGEANGPFQPMPAVYHLYVNDTDAAYRRAVAAGGISLSEPADQPWGFRSAGVQDPGGNQWWINTPIDAAHAAGDETDAPSVAPTEAATHTLTSFLIVPEVRRTADFLTAAFGAEITLFDRGGDPPHDHAELRLGDSMMMMGEAVPGSTPTTSAFYLRVADVDAAYERALRAGATSAQEPRDMPWGDRMAHVADPLGNTWFIAGKGES